MIPEALAPLANHLWQSTLFAVAAGFVILLLRKNAARVRHWVWVAAALKFLVPFSLLVALGGGIQWGTKSILEADAPRVLDQISQPFTPHVMSFPLLATVPPVESRLSMALSLLWATGFIMVTCSWWSRWRRIVVAVRNASTANLGLPIPVIFSRSLLEPSVYGVFRPVMLLPEGIFEYLTPEQWKTVLSHELCHVRYRDNLIAVVQMFIEAVFWFHPLVWWIGDRIVEERERACDEEVLRLGNEPRIYAQGILKVCELYLESPATCVAGVSGSNLRKRIEGIMTGHHMRRELNRGRKLLLAAFAALSVTAPVIVGGLNLPTARAQQALTETAPEFEVASIKRNVSGAAGPRFSFGPITHIENATVRELVLLAYDVKGFQVSGGPGFITSERYNIEATFEATAAPAGPALTDGVRRRLQSLLRDRFHLTLHRETKSLPIYELTVAKGGLKVQPLKDGSCAPFDMDKVRAPGAEPMSFCGSWGFGSGFFEASSISMAELAGRLSREVGRIVVDKTEVKGVFRVHLTYQSAPVAANPGGGPATAPTSDDRPSIFTALQEQLGLRLESARGPVEVLVIDRAEHPSAN